MLPPRRGDAARQSCRSSVRFAGWNAAAFLMLTMAVHGDDLDSVCQKKNSQKYAGTCAHGELIALCERTQEDHCGTCDAGYQLSLQTCRAFGGICEFGDLISPQSSRTGDNQCGSCKPGYDLQSKKCWPHGGTCPNGQLALQHERIEDDHCGSCDPGYDLRENACHAFAGKCANGNLIFPQGLRTENDHCGTCNDGYFLKDKKCLPWRGTCANGNLVSQSKRTQHNQCGSCNPGYVLFEPFFPVGVATAANDAGFGRKECRSYEGTCANGKLIFPQSKRSADGQCGSCNPGYILEGTKCKRCRDCFWTTSGASLCNPCDYVLHAIDAENSSGCDLPSTYYKNCPFNPFIHLASKSGLGNWSDMVKWLHKKGFDVNMEDPSNHTRTPVVAAVEHCMDSSFNRRKLMEDLVLHYAADTLTGAPTVTAQGCNKKWMAFLATHPQGLSLMEKWVRMSSSWSFRRSVMIAIPVGLVVGLCLHGLSWVRGTGEQMNRGALQLAAMALYPVSLGWLHYFMCVFAVIANIVWPFLVVMCLIQKWFVLAMYAGFAWVPAVCVRTYIQQTWRSWQLDKPALAALPVAYDLHKKQWASGFHVFTVVRLIIGCHFALMLAHGDTENFKQAENVTGFPVRQLYHFKASASNSSSSWRESPHWLVNADTTLYRNPSHLPRSPAIPLPLGLTLRLPLRRIFYTFRGSVDIVALLWGVMTLCLVLWPPFKRNCINTKEETAPWQDAQEDAPLLSTDEQTEMEMNLKELVTQIKEAADKGLKPGELTVEREWKQILPSWLKQRWPRWPSCLSAILPSEEWRTCLRFQVQPAIAEEELPNKLKAVAWASEIREKKPVTNGTFKVFHIYLPEGSLIEVTDGTFKVFYKDVSQGFLTSNTLSGLNEELQQALSPQKIMGTPKIVEVRNVPYVDKYGLLMDIFFIAADVITDLLQIRNMYMDEFYLMGGTLLSVLVASMTAQICSGELCKLPQEFRDSLHNGIKTDVFLGIVDREKGFEGFMSLALSCYLVYWQVNPTSCIMSLVSIIMSGRGVATYLFHTVFLERAMDFL